MMADALACPDVPALSAVNAAGQTLLMAVFGFSAVALIAAAPSKWPIAGSMLLPRRIVVTTAAALLSLTLLHAFDVLALTGCANLLIAAWRLFTGLLCLWASAEIQLNRWRHGIEAIESRLYARTAAERAADLAAANGSDPRPAGTMGQGSGVDP